MNTDALIAEARSFLGGAGEATLVGRLADALDEVGEIVLGLDYASDFDRIQALSLLFENEGPNA